MGSDRLPANFSQDQRHQRYDFDIVLVAVGEVEGYNDVPMILLKLQLFLFLNHALPDTQQGVPDIVIVYTILLNLHHQHIPDLHHQIPHLALFRLRFPLMR